MEVSTGAVSGRDDGAPALWVVATILAIPLAVVIGYGSLSSHSPDPLSLHANSADAARGPAPGPAPGPVAAPQRGGAESLPPDIEKMVEGLAKRLEAQPNDPAGWGTLARSYYVLKRFSAATAAYERLLEIAPPDANTLADYADALAMTQNRSLAGKPIELVRRALELDPTQWKALSMAGAEAFARNDYRGAIGYWQKARAVVPPESDNARQLAASIEEATRLSAAAPGAGTPRR